METKRKALALIRVSTGEQALHDKQGVETQLDDIAYACETHNLEVVETFRLIGISGATIDTNPEFKRMLAILAQPDISGVIISRWDRWMRPEHIDQYSVFKVFRDKSKLIYTAQTERGLNPGNDDDRAIILKSLEAAHAYRKEFRRVTTRAKEKLLLAADVSVLKLPAFVTHDKKDPKGKAGIFRYTPVAFTQIKPAALEVAAGASIGSVATKYGFSSETNCRNMLLNPWLIGMKTRTHKRPFELDETGNPKIDEATGMKIYAKRTTHHKPVSIATNLAGDMLATPENPTCGPLVSAETFARIQDITAANHRTWTQQASNTGKFLGTKFLRCENCGKKLYLRNWERKGQPPVYHCSGKCGFKAVRAIATDAGLWQGALDVFKNHGLVTSYVLKGLDTSEAMNRHAALAAAETRLAELDKAKKGILRALEVDEADEDALNRFKAIKQEIAAARIRHATAKIQAEPFGTNDAETIARLVCDFYQGTEHFTMDERQRAFDATLEAVYISVDGKARFVVKGGLPVPSKFQQDMEKVASILADEQRRAYQERKAENNNKMEISCWKTFQFVVQLEGIRYREQFLEIQPVTAVERVA